MESRSRNWCFTWNNYPEDYQNLTSTLNPKYIVMGEEVGESGTKHIQGYLELKNARGFKALHKAFPEIHWEQRKGTSEEASDYCKKDGKFFEMGERTEGTPGKRSDLNEFATAVREGMTNRELLDNYPGMYLRYQRHVEDLRRRFEDWGRNPPKVFWYWGKAGVGKTHKAVEEARHLGSGGYYIKDGSQWWDGYRTGWNVIIDDFDGRWPFRDLLRLLDRYPYQGQTKGGYVQIRADYIYITCEFPPSYFWSGNDLAQIQRRIFMTEQIGDWGAHGTEVGGNTRAPTSPEGSNGSASELPDPPKDWQETLARLLVGVDLTQGCKP